jgi:hypothetical protein
MYRIGHSRATAVRARQNHGASPAARRMLASRAGAFRPTRAGLGEHVGAPRPVRQLLNTRQSAFSSTDTRKKLRFPGDLKWTTCDDFFDEIVGDIEARVAC